TDGSLDTAFGTGGIAATNYGNMTGEAEIGLRSDGKIVIADVYRNPAYPPPSFVSAIALARLMPDGTFDTSFGSSATAGRTLVSGLFIRHGLGMVVQPDDKIVISGDDYYSSFGIAARILPTGAVESKFSPWLGSLMPDSIALQPNGNILFGGGNGLLGATQCLPDG